MKLRSIPGTTLPPKQPTQGTEGYEWKRETGDIESYKHDQTGGGYISTRRAISTTVKPSRLAERMPLNTQHMSRSIQFQRIQSLHPTAEITTMIKESACSPSSTTLRTSFSVLITTNGSRIGRCLNGEEALLVSGPSVLRHPPQYGGSPSP